MHNPFLIGKKIYLRAPTDGDEYIYALSENNPETRHFLYYGFPTSPGQKKEKIESMVNDQHTVLFTICSKEPDKPIGNTAFVRIDWIGRMGTFYIAIAEKENWSKGYGSEATRMMVNYAFDTLNLNRIQLHVSKENQPALNTYRKIGFKEEGTLRQAMYFDGRYIDFYLMAILKEDFSEAENKNR
ncbi:MAG TPA: N-acetyltransferase [Calditrichaeota bacterium]|nr:N-acetyltransferase [Calditrichota bacterium]